MSLQNNTRALAALPLSVSQVPLMPMSLDHEFVNLCYRRLLGRTPDESGLRASLHALAGGVSRFDLLVSMAESPEYCKRMTRGIFSSVQLPNLQKIRPAKYERVRLVSCAETPLTFRADAPADYDWLEAMILEHGYYERPGVWALEIDQDKQIIAENIGHFAPERVLELGCANGPVLKLLHEQGIHAEGVEISHMAHALAFAKIRRNIHYGDLLTLTLKSDYDMIVGMDLFEHLNPNKLPSYVERCFGLLRDGGTLYTNIPAFGNDPVFGEVFQVYLDLWKADRPMDQLFSHLPTDEAGWPLNGHLIWATALWWQRIFEREGFARETGIERALHEVYDGFFLSSAPARRSFFVFSKNASPARVGQIAARVIANGSVVLRSLGAA